MTATLPLPLPHPTTATGSRFRGARRRERGFTLIEIAIAVFIIALLLSSILVPLHTQVEQRQVSETQKTLEDIKVALIGHAVAKGYLPCPDRTTVVPLPAYTPNDTPNDGVEDFSAGNCIGTVTGTAGGPPNTLRAVGNVPWVTLGLGASDPWGNRFRYAVDMEFSNHSAFFSFTSAAVLNVRATGGGALLTGIDPDGAVAVILSHGRNGRSAINATGTANPAATSADELDNVGGSGYISRPITAAGPTTTEFDDIVTWLGKYTLFNRMVAAGKLP